MILYSARRPEFLHFLIFTLLVKYKLTATTTFTSFVAKSLAWNTQISNALTQVCLASLFCSFGKQDGADFNVTDKKGTHSLFSASY